MTAGEVTQPKPQGFRIQDLPGKIWSNYVLRRIVRALVIIWLITTIIFFVIRLMPGNAFDLMVADMVVNRNMTEDEAKIRASSLLRINFNRPIGEQYLEYMSNLAKGDLGYSFINNNRTVQELLAQKLPWTLFSVGTSLMISFTLGMLLGMIAAYKRGSWLDHLITNFAAAMDAIPQYIYAIVLVLLLGVIWKIMPVMDMKGVLSPGIKPGFTFEFIWDALMHLRVPAFVYVLSTVGNWALSMKSSTLSTLGEDYVTVARARGLSDSRIITSYVGRNASLPLVTALALSVGFALGGSVVIESVFNYPGIGLELSKSLSNRDYPMLQGIFLITTTSVIFTNLIADLIYGWLDPRIRIAGGE
ncbi:MAG TPA: ABC transporter permease [Anaerolineaceae bacterium]|nr:ABC transporter permease [Anaerolineaceae bacterium]HPN52352.1 ABC transporter permease [Anaerolineaceae bacterium]